MLSLSVFRIGAQLLKLKIQYVIFTSDEPKRVGELLCLLNSQSRSEGKKAKVIVKTASQCIRSFDLQINYRKLLNKNTFIYHNYNKTTYRRSSVHMIYINNYVGLTSLALLKTMYSHVFQEMLLLKLQEIFGLFCVRCCDGFLPKFQV